MNHIEKLKQDAKKTGSIVSMGMDPVLADIPLTGKPSEVIYNFYEALLNEILSKNIYPASVKPNFAFYAQYGLEGIDSLYKLVKLYKNAGIDVILDVKRGDIGKTAGAYAKESFEFLNGDAVTLAPYMGYDSISPFMDNFPNKGYYILTKTSNKSSGELQDIDIDKEKLYIKTAKLILKWYQPGIGSVVGATYPEQLDEICKIFINSGKEIPLLIPGIGSQGGDLNAVINILNNFEDPTIHRINSSSGINYAYKKTGDKNFAKSAISALKELNDNINKILK